MIKEQYIDELLSEEFTKNDTVHEVHPKVSISLLAYNHEAFVAKAIESVLFQKVNFAYEIIIGEDCSLDSTRVIVLDYQRKYPDKIRVFLSKEPLNNRQSGRLNFIRNLKACRGEYVALLDGDDYWTSPHKLQKQVDYLDKHPTCAICFHDVFRLYEDGSTQPWGLPSVKKERYILEDLLEGNFIPTCSTMFRNKLFDEFPEWYYEAAMGDWPLHILNAHNGDIGFIDEAMGVYKIHSGGMWSSKNTVDLLHKSIRAAETIQQGLSLKHREKMENTIGHFYWEIIKNQPSERNSKSASVRPKRSTKNTLVEKFIATKDIVKNLHSSGRKESASTIIKCLKDEIFALADEENFKEASLCAKKFLCTFGHRRNAARTDLITLILSIDFPRAHKILASIRRTVLRKCNGYRKGQTEEYPSTV